MYCVHVHVITVAYNEAQLIQPTPEKVLECCREEPKQTFVHRIAWSLLNVVTAHWNGKNIKTTISVLYNNTIK